MNYSIILAYNLILVKYFITVISFIDLLIVKIIILETWPILSQYSFWTYFFFIIIFMLQFCHLNFLINIVNQIGFFDVKINK